MKKYYIAEGDKLISVLYVPIGTRPENVIPKHIKIIGPEAFRDANGIIKLIIPEGVERIERGAFYGNTGLQEIILPESLISVGDGAFAGCTNLRYMKYGSKTVFGYNCFSNCAQLKWIESEGIKARTFYFVHINSFAITIEQPQLSNERYKVYRGRFAKAFFPTEVPDQKQTPVYFTETADQKYFWYSNNLEECFTALDFQSSHLSFNEFFKKTILPDGVITPMDFSFLTGICWAGRKGWSAAFGGDDYTEFNLQDVLGILERRYPKLHGRLVYALQVQDKYNPILSIDNGITTSDFYNSFMASKEKYDSQQ